MSNVELSVNKLSDLLKKLCLCAVSWWLKFDFLCRKKGQLVNHTPAKPWGWAMGEIPVENRGSRSRPMYRDGSPATVLSPQCGKEVAAPRKVGFTPTQVLLRPSPTSTPRGPCNESCGSPFFQKFPNNPHHGTTQPAFLEATSRRSCSSRL